MISHVATTDIAPAQDAPRSAFHCSITNSSLRHAYGELRLREQASQALRRTTDPRAYKAVSAERVYVRAREIEPNTFVSAGLHEQPLESAIALLDWGEFIGGAPSAQGNLPPNIAEAIGQAIATDFCVSANGSGPSNNVGAFWQRLTIPGDSQPPLLSDSRGGHTLSLTATADIAELLLQIYERTGNRVCLNSALHASQWLLLKQHPDGSYSGDQVDARGGAVAPDENAGRKAAVHAAGAFVHAFRASGAEIYMKAATRALRHVAGCALASCRSIEPVSRLARNTALIYAESASLRNRENLQTSADLLRDSQRSSSVSNALETELSRARAALDLFVALSDAEWLQFALRSLQTAAAAGMPAECEAVSAFFATLLALPTLIQGCQSDLRDGHVRVGWTSYAADTATRDRVNVTPVSSTGARSIDYLPLASKIGRNTLVPVLAHEEVAEIKIRSGRRYPDLTDLVTGGTVVQPVSLHRMPFSSEYVWGCYLIEH